MLYINYCINLQCIFLQELSDGIYYYYVVQLAFYCGLLLSQFVDVKRKVSS